MCVEEEDGVWVTQEEFEELKFYDSFLRSMNAVNLVLELDPLRITWICENEAALKMFGIPAPEVIQMGESIITRVLKGTDFEESVINQVDAFREDPTVRWAGVFRLFSNRTDIKWLIYGSSALELDDNGMITKIAVVVLAVDDIFNTSRTLHSFKDHILREVGRVEVESLTEKQKKILTLVGKGHERIAIAEIMNISVHTVADHISSLYKKFNLNNTQDLILLSRRIGLVAKA